MLAFFFLSACMLDECISGSPKGGIDWHTSYEEGMARGKAQKKNVFINFYTDWCGFCTKMYKETFTDPEVIGYMNDHFISIKVNSDNQQKVATRYYVRGLPTSWFVSDEGEKISSLPGYVPADMLIKILKYIHTGNYKKMTFKKFMNM